MGRQSVARINIYRIEQLYVRKPTKEQAVMLLREHPNEEAFYFNNDLGSSTGAFAKSLSQFIDAVKVVEQRSLNFHMNRGDFEKWITMLGDETLSHQLSNLRQHNLKDEPLRRRILQIIRLRQGYLRKIAYPKIAEEPS